MVGQCALLALPLCPLLTSLQNMRILSPCHADEYGVLADQSTADIIRDHAAAMKSYDGALKDSCGGVC
jgi:hypothetical protein